MPKHIARLCVVIVCVALPIAFIPLFLIILLTVSSLSLTVKLLIGLALLIYTAIAALLVYRISLAYTQGVEQRIRKTNRHIEKTFISHASHELNNPLTAIQGECEITLMKERTVLEYQHALQRIEEETRRIIFLMKQLLFLSHDEEEMLMSEIQALPLAEFLKGYAGNRISFTTDNFAFVVKANPHLLKMAIDNLINNALKYSDDKPVELRLRGSVLEIQDRGIGIPEEDLRRIAQPFFRATNSDEYQGHGIGLSLSTRILNSYGAKVTISSIPNLGTTISIDFRFI
ncbi:HAMP domain-containing histidine kinase [Parabacteroides sp. OttesenSCG-928-N08]|nr:HAMP domain-containing histidine kinase [Parabacteroides sp. OttesenSCG-928-N08]